MHCYLVFMAVTLLNLYYNVIGQVAELLIQKVLVPPSQKAKLVEATEVRDFVAFLPIWTESK